MRHLFAILLMLAVLGAAGYTLWTWNTTVSQQADPWSAVPQQTALMIELPDAWSTYDRITHTAQLWNTFSRLPGVSASGALMERIAGRMESDAALRAAIGGRPMLMAILRSGGERVGILFVGERSGGGSLADQALADVLGANGNTAELLASGAVVQIRPDTALPSLSLCTPPGLWLLATDAGVMDEALLNLKSGISIANDPQLAKARATLGAGIDAHVLVNTGRLQSLLNSWWKPDALEHLDLPAGWAALDVRARPDALLMSGLLVPDSGETMLQAMVAQGLGGTTVLRALPAQVAMTNMQYITDTDAWITHRGTKDDAQAASLFSWVQGSVGIATEPGNDIDTDRSWAFFETADTEAASTALNATCTTGCDTMNYRGMRLTRLPFGGAHERILGTRFEHLERPWWCALGEVVLFSDDPRSLMSSIDVWNDGGSLAEDPRTTEWNKRMSNDASATNWCDLARAWPYLARGLRTNSANGNGTDSLYADLGGLTLQWSPGQRGFHHVMIGLQHAPLAQPASALAWTTELGAAVDRHPTIVQNHVNKTREVLVQDTQHRLHLLASTGKILWTRQLDGPMLGEARQVDRFRNEKLQLLLNTTTSIYLIDRNGKDVGGFPVKLRSPATAPLAVFDYENDRDYRVLVPTADATIANFGLDGEAVKGWERPSLPTPAGTQVQHLRIKGQDHLIVVCTDGSIHILDRRGAARERTNVRLSEAPRAVEVQPGPELFSSKVLWHDEQGKHWVSELKGSAPPAQQQTGYRTVGDSLMVIEAGVQRLLRTFGSSLGSEVIMAEIPRQATFLIVDRPGMGQLSILDESGVELNGSPVLGTWTTMPMDLDLDGHFEWITVTREGVVAAHRLPAFRASTP